MEAPPSTTAEGADPKRKTHVDLKGGDSAIDDSLDGIVITQPGKDLTEKELRRIDEFVLKGKSLAVIASSVNVKPSDPTMNATLSAHGLEKLLSGYGIELRKDVVLDFNHGFNILIRYRAPVEIPHGAAILVDLMKRVPALVHCRCRTSGLSG